MLPSIKRILDQVCDRPRLKNYACQFPAPKYGYTQNQVKLQFPHSEAGASINGAAYNLLQSRRGRPAVVTHQGSMIERFSIEIALRMAQVQ